MSWIKRKVVMLPTNEKANIKLIDNQFLLIGAFKDWLKSDEKFQNLYILSDEEPKNDDWVYYKHPACEEAMITKIVKWDYCDYQPYSVQHLEGFGVKTRYSKIIASTDKSLELPCPSARFVSTFVVEYNEDNIITEVLVKYDEIGPMKSGNNYISIVQLLKVKPNNTISIRKVKNEWSRTEMFDEMQKFCIDCGYPIYELTNWFDKNI